MKKPYISPLLLATFFIINGCSDSDSTRSADIKKDNPAATTSAAIGRSNTTANTDALLLNTLIKNNQAAYVPAQCYTKTTVGEDVHNPCYSCHTTSKEPNYIDDASFQLSYEFRTYTRSNRWSNLFRDRTNDVKAISDATIIKYVRHSNYFDREGDIKLANKLARIPTNWDFNQNGEWEGYTPDSYFNFDTEGFDQTPEGHDSGWRAFAYTPFLGTFWPTNGSTDDVLIRLPEAMRQDDKGQYSRSVYALNLSIVEAMIKRENIAINETDESIYNVDLNRNGTIDTAQQVVYLWNPRKGQQMSYVGRAKTLLEQGKLHIAGGLYPEGTEFLHTVRYIDVGENNTVSMAARIKELRYSYKHSWNNYNQLNNAAVTEVKEGEQRPDRLRTLKGNPEYGLFNGQGWTYQGFIEDQDGELRPQSYEETLSCMGCHSGIAATTDNSFAFARKLDQRAPQNGWSHGSQHGLVGVPEPQWRDGTWEYTEYLKQNRSGNEFRNNDEVIEKFFDAEGNPKTEMVQRLHSDISELLLPSPQRALLLNKAYKVIVDEQSYIYGKDPHIKPVETVWDEVPEQELTGVTELVIAR